MGRPGFGRRSLVARNLLKLWALLVACSLFLGAAGWEAGGYRAAILFLGSVVLLAAALYAYADRISMGMLGARELAQAEAPALHSTLERLAAQIGVVKPKLFVFTDGHPRALSSGRGASGGSALAISAAIVRTGTSSIWVESITRSRSADSGLSWARLKPLCYRAKECAPRSSPRSTMALASAGWSPMWLARTIAVRRLRLCVRLFAAGSRIT